jgi:S1-C subfamily serine protease
LVLSFALPRRRGIFVAVCAVLGAMLLSGQRAGTRGDASAAAAAGHADSGVVRVEAIGCQRALLGTGFLVDRNHVATAAHVVGGATRINLRQGSRTVGAGTIVGADWSRDVALVRTDAPIDGHVFSLAERRPQVSERVALLGFPRGRPLVERRGLVRGIAHIVPAGKRLIQTDATMQHGDSGGPLVSVADGTVLGMLNMSSTSGGTPSFAVSSSDVGPLLARWRADPEAVPQRRCR